jgi:RNA polymerase sigma factor (sigma-70 family)
VDGSTTMARPNDARKVSTDDDPIAFAIERECLDLLIDASKQSPGPTENQEPPRRSDALPAIDPSERAAVASSVSDSESAAERQRRSTMEALGCLPPECQAAFTLRMFEGLSYSEIATTLGICTERVGHHVTRGLLRVHSHLARHRNW